MAMASRILKGSEQKLNYPGKAQGLAIWLSPVYKGPMDDSVWHLGLRGYCLLFGTMEDMEKIDRRRSKRKIKIIMVVNHTSDEHAWFIEGAWTSRQSKRDFIFWRDELMVLFLL